MTHGKPKRTGITATTSGQRRVPARGACMRSGFIGGADRLVVRALSEHNRCVIAVVAAVSTLAGTPAFAVSPRSPRSHADATVVSVDGPGVLTLRTVTGRLKVRLDMIDTPQAGECGAPKSEASLEQLTQGRRKRVRYVLWSRRPDAGGRYPALVGPRHASLLDHSLARDLVRREWARVTEPRKINDGLTFSPANEAFAARPQRGVWAICGGLMHLAAGDAVPAHAPAPWNIDADGVTESIGPIELPAELAPDRSLTVKDVAALARVESTPAHGSTCRARVPSLELLLLASPVGTTCGGEIYAVVSSGPGAAASTLGLRVGQPARAAPPLFRNLAGATPDQLDSLGQIPLSGLTPKPWAWQTLAAVDPASRSIVGFVTSTAPWVN